MVGVDSCQHEQTHRHVRVKTWSGDSSRLICDVKDRADAKHFVKVENYKTYPITVHCTGSIRSDPRMVQFHCPGHPEVTSAEWKAKAVLPAKSSPGRATICELSHVVLLTGDVSGNDNVHTCVHIRWHRRRTAEVSLGFGIST